MTSRLLARVKHLESQPELVPRPELIQCGWLIPLPVEYVGELHVVAIHGQAAGPGIEWCEFEERPGSAPPGTEGFIRSIRRD